MEASISVIIPVLNGEAVMGGCLEAVLGQDLPASRYEVLVVDNGSTDRTMDIVQQYPAVRLLTEPVRSAYAARNTGIRHARGEILAFTDADCRPARDWLSCALPLFDRGAERVAGGIDHEVVNPRNPWECHNVLFYLNQQAHAAEGWAATANLLARRALFERLGAFEPWESGADRAWGLRASAQHVSLHYQPAAVVRHVTRKSFRAIAEQLRRVEAGNGRLLREQSERASSGSPMMRTRRFPVSFHAFRAYQQGRIPLRAAWILTLAWPILEGIRCSAFYQGWQHGSAKQTVGGT